MKNKLDKETIWLTLLVAVCLVLIIIASNQLGSQYPAYSVLNKSQTGYSIFYKALQEQDYPVARTLKPISDLKPDSIQIITTRQFEIDLEAKPDWKEWVKKGGVLILLTPEKPTLDNSEQVEELFEEEKFPFRLDKQGQGIVVKVNRKLITNAQLIEEPEQAYSLVTQIENYDYQQVYFNEHHLFSGHSSKTLWTIIPWKLKLILYQLVLIIAAIFYYYGRRFGKPKPLQSEVERTENEYLYSAAALYRQAECWDLLVEYYYNDFLNRLGCSHDSWLSYWESQDLPAFKQAEQVYEFMDQLPEGSVPDKQAVRVIDQLENLKEIIKQRRDKYWNRLKMNM